MIYHVFLPGYFFLMTSTPAPSFKNTELMNMQRLYNTKAKLLDTTLCVQHRQTFPFQQMNEKTTSAFLTLLLHHSAQ